MSLALWLSGRLLVGSKKAKFTDAIWISVLGSIASYAVGYFLTGLLGGLLGMIVTLIIVLLLVKHFFDCGWLKALLIAIVAAIIFIIVVAILGIIGIGVVALI
jgi:predicted lysophospholipase L1 biosynthesis ABC-type transport system permease subunit